MSTYKRVVPRDLFNEAKLLKCLGRIQILIEDRKLMLESEFDGDRFLIEQDDSDGSLFCTNLKFTLGDQEIYFFTDYNSKLNYPIIARYLGETYYALSEDGNWMPDWGVAKPNRGNK